jgi:hypothetical protein
VRLDDAEDPFFEVGRVGAVGVRPGQGVECGRPVSVELELRRPSYSSYPLHLGKTFTES